MASHLTRSVGSFLAKVSYDELPAKAVDAAKTGITDALGVLVAGMHEPVVTKLVEVLGTGNPEARVLLGSQRTRAVDAALINGVAAHALDFDDVALRGHPSTVLAPAILAEAEAIGADGRRVLTAYVAGYEVWAELVFRESGHHHQKGWHPTGVFGAVAAAAACAVLHGLDAEKSTHAVAIGASGSAGLMANFGTMTKPFHAGRSASAGVLAARLAAQGMNGSEDALEHPQGFLRAISPTGEVDVEKAADGLGKEWRILQYGISVKKYPLCYCTHRNLDAILDLLAERPVQADEVDEIEVLLSETHAVILRNHLPQTGLEAKFSIEFAMAASIVDGLPGLDQLQDNFARRDDVQALMKRVRVSTTTDYDPEALGFSMYDQVKIKLKNGDVLESAQVRRARGHSALPLSREELRRKFIACVAFTAPDADAAALFAMVQALDSLSDVADLVLPGPQTTKIRETQ